LGAGQTGTLWAEDFLEAGWRVRIFDPDPSAATNEPLKSGTERAGTISGCVALADWILIALPDRLDLMQKVIQRAQAEAPRDAITAVVSRSHDIEAIQNCALHPAKLIKVARHEDGGFDMNVTSRNPDDFRNEAVLALSGLSAVRTIGADYAHPIIRDDVAQA
jgi:3-hydroxyacyl-CoA dehydrogenase